MPKTEFFYAWTDQTNILRGHKCLSSFQEFCLKYVEMDTGKSKARIV